MEQKAILIVDVDASSRRYLAGILREKGYRVLQAASGKEGLVVAWRDRPDLILAEPILPDLDVETFIGKIRQHPRTATTPCIAFSRDAGQERREQCLNSGYNEFLVKSPQALPALFEAISRLLQAAAEETQRLKNGLLVVFLSAKGGTGTSSLCANLATEIARERSEESIVVADLVLPIGSIAPIVGYEGEVNLVTVAEMPAEQTTVSYFRNSLPSLPTWYFYLLAGSPDPEQANRLQVGRIEEIVRTLRVAFDYVVIDLGRSLSRISLPLIHTADVIVLILSTDLSTVTLTRTVWNFLEARGITGERVYAILNRAVGLEGLSRKEAEEIVGLPIRVTVPYLREDFTLANNHHQPLLHRFPQTTAAMVFRQAAGEIVELGQRSRSASPSVEVP